MKKQIWIPATGKIKYKNKPCNVLARHHRNGSVLFRYENRLMVFDWQTMQYGDYQGYEYV